METGTFRYNVYNIISTFFPSHRRNRHLEVENPGHRRARSHPASDAAEAHQRAARQGHGTGAALGSEGHRSAINVARCGRARFLCHRQTEGDQAADVYARFHSATQPPEVRDRRWRWAVVIGVSLAGRG